MSHDNRLRATDILAGDQVSFFPSVFWLTEVWRYWQLNCQHEKCNISAFLLSAHATVA